METSPIPIGPKKGATGGLLHRRRGGWRWRTPRPGQVTSTCAQKNHGIHGIFINWVWINTYENTIFSGMNIQLNQLF